MIIFFITKTDSQNWLYILKKILQILSLDIHLNKLKLRFLSITFYFST